MNTFLSLETLIRNFGAKIYRLQLALM